MNSVKKCSGEQRTRKAHLAMVHADMQCLLNAIMGANMGQRRSGDAKWSFEEHESGRGI